MHAKVRNWIGFWLLGLCNNYAYVIMLSAAHDLLDSSFHGNDDEIAIDEGKKNGTIAICNPTSSAAILLADIVPSLMTKAISPFIFTNTQLRVLIVILLSAASFLITCFSVSNFMTFVGVIAASMSSGLGEVSFLGYSANFDKRVVSGWSSGTGAAGLVGSGVYFLLKMFLSTRVTLGVQLVIPVLMTFTFYILVVHPKPGQLEAAAHRRFYESTDSLPIVDMQETNGLSTDNSLTSLNMIPIPEEITLRDKIRLIRRLFLRFMLPLGLVYYFEYFINQGLYELVIFGGSLKVDTQYRLFNNLYQVGVFISRSSVQFIQIKSLWTLPYLQGLNFSLFLIQVIYPFFGSIYVAIILILFEGLLGGAAYVNTFYIISQESEPRYKSFSMSITSLADSLGITLAALSSIPTHDALCPFVNGRVL
jgi:battenin